MPFVKANMEKEREELNRLIETDPEARKAHEEFMAQYERRKQLAEAEKKENHTEGRTENRAEGRKRKA